MVVFWSLHRQPLRCHAYVIHPRQLWLGPRVRHPYRWHDRDNSSFFMLEENLCKLQEKPLCVGKNSINIEAKNEEKNPKTENYWMENTKVIVRLLPIWTVLLPFVVIFQQPSTFFMTMQRQIRSSFKVPPATLQSAMTLSIMVSMPLYDKVFIPLTRVITRNEKGVSVLQRIGIGMVLSVIAMVIAALVETKRLEIGRNTKISDWDNTVISPCLNSIFRFWVLLLIFVVFGNRSALYPERQGRTRPEFLPNLKRRMYIDDRRWLERCPDISHCRYRNFNGNFRFRSCNRDGELAIIGLAAAGHPFIWVAVLTNVGTCLLVILNSMLLLRGTDNKKSSTNSRHDHKHGCKTKSRHSPHKHGNCCSGKSDHKPKKCSSGACCGPISKSCSEGSHRGHSLEVTDHRQDHCKVEDDIHEVDHCKHGSSNAITHDVESKSGCIFHSHSNVIEEDNNHHHHRHHHHHIHEDND
ncbi:hypothetical protein ACFE04_019532 [Oxalis oulophora]